MNRADREPEAHDLALRACREQGCTCEPDIEVESIVPNLAPFGIVHTASNENL